MAIGDMDMSAGDQGGGSVDYSGLGQQALSLPQPGQSQAGQPTFSWQQLLKNMANSFANGGRPQTGPAGTTATQSNLQQATGGNPASGMLSAFSQAAQGQNLQAQSQQNMQNLQNNPMGSNLASAFKKLFNWGSSSTSGSGDSDSSSNSGIGQLDTTVADSSPTQDNAGDQGSDNDAGSIWDDGE